MSGPACTLCKPEDVVAEGHVIVVPRRQGDVPDPRGGVRCVLAKRG